MIFFRDLDALKSRQLFWSSSLKTKLLSSLLHRDSNQWITMGSQIPMWNCTCCLGLVRYVLPLFGPQYKVFRCERGNLQKSEHHGVAKDLISGSVEGCYPPGWVPCYEPRGRQFTPQGEKKVITKPPCNTRTLWLTLQSQTVNAIGKDLLNSPFCTQSFRNWFVSSTPPMVHWLLKEKQDTLFKKKKKRRQNKQLTLKLTCCVNSRVPEALNQSQTACVPI